MAKRTDRSRKLPRPLKIPGVMDLETPADVRTLISHVPKETRAKSTWQIVETKLTKAAAGGDIVELFVTLRIVLQLENVEYQMKEAAAAYRPRLPSKVGSPSGQVHEMQKSGLGPLKKDSGGGYRGSGLCDRHCSSPGLGVSVLRGGRIVIASGAKHCAADSAVAPRGCLKRAMTIRVVS